MSYQPPRTSDPLDLLLKHNAWATRDLLRLCVKLDDEQWRRRFEIGPGSLHDTFTHIIGAMFRWADRIDGPARALRPSIEQSPRPTLPDGPFVQQPVVPHRTVAELLKLLEEAESDLAASAARAVARGLETVGEIKFGEKLYHFTLGAMLVHVTTHGMHHRAQCLNMLRRLNVPGVSDQLPDTDVLEWQGMMETGEIATR